MLHLQTSLITHPQQPVMLPSHREARKRTVPLASQTNSTHPVRTYTQYYRKSNKYSHAHTNTKPHSQSHPSSPHAADLSAHSVEPRRSQCRVESRYTSAACVLVCAYVWSPVRLDLPASPRQRARVVLTPPTYIHISVSLVSLLSTADRSCMLQSVLFHLLLFPWPVALRFFVVVVCILYYCCVRAHERVYMCCVRWWFLTLWAITTHMLAILCACAWWRGRAYGFVIASSEQRQQQHTLACLVSASRLQLCKCASRVAAKYCVWVCVRVCLEFSCVRASKLITYSQALTVHRLQYISVSAVRPKFVTQTHMFFTWELAQYKYKVHCEPWLFKKTQNRPTYTRCTIYSQRMPAFSHKHSQFQAR